jgi:hypothetical protein
MAVLVLPLKCQTILRFLPHFLKGVFLKLGPDKIYGQSSEIFYKRVLPFYLFLVRGYGYVYT